MTIEFVPQVEDKLSPIERLEALCDPRIGALPVGEVGEQSRVTVDASYNRTADDEARFESGFSERFAQDVIAQAGPKTPQPPDTAHSPAHRRMWTQFALRSRAVRRPRPCPVLARH